MPPVNPRRQTLAGVQAKPPTMPPSTRNNSTSYGSSGSGNASVSGGSIHGGGIGAPPARRRVPLARKSMIPRCAGGSLGDDTNVNRENNGRASGIAAPSPSRQRLQPAAAPSRKSLGGLQYTSSYSTSSSTPAKNRRVSLAPSSSSINNGSTTVPGSSSNIDPRDIKDKSYLQNAIRKMVSYLTTRGYRDASTLSIKQLVNNGPSGRDFQNIMTFLFRRMDPTFFPPPPATPGNQRSDEIIPKFEDEVSMAFRSLGYPFPISKTGLVAVGSPHTWPALIAAIDWLVDTLVIRDEEDAYEYDILDDDETNVQDEQQQQEVWLTFSGNANRLKQQYYKFLRKSMVAFLKDDSAECEELEAMLLDTYLKDCGKVEQYVTGLDEECSKMREDIAVMNEEVNG